MNDGREIERSRLGFINMGVATTEIRRRSRGHHAGVMDECATKGLVGVVTNPLGACVAHVSAKRGSIVPLDWSLRLSGYNSRHR